MMIAIQSGDKIANFKDEYEKIVNNITIGKALEILDTKEKEIILLRYYKEMTQVQIAKILNTSQVQVSRIEKKALKKMRDVVYVL
jgi:RNA polymerase sporulation-specific sigma factor